MRFRIKLVIISSKGNFIYRDVESDKPNFDVKFRDHVYHVKREGLYADPEMRIGKLPIIRTIGSKAYRIVFWENDSNHIRPIKPKLSPEELDIIANSRALRDGLDEKFREALSLKNIFTIIAALAFLVFGLKYLGYI